MESISDFPADIAAGGDRGFFNCIAHPAAAAA